MTMTRFAFGIAHDSPARDRVTPYTSPVVYACGIVTERTMLGPAASLESAYAVARGSLDTPTVRTFPGRIDDADEGLFYDETSPETPSDDEE